MAGTKGAVLTSHRSSKLSVRVNFDRSYRRVRVWNRSSSAACVVSCVSLSRGGLTRRESEEKSRVVSMSGVSVSTSPNAEAHKKSSGKRSVAEAVLGYASLWTSQGMCIMCTMRGEEKKE